MSRRAYRVEYIQIKNMPQNYAFIDWLQNNFENDDQQVYVYPERLDELIEKKPEDAKEFKEEIKELKAELARCKYDAFDITFF